RTEVGLGVELGNLTRELHGKAGRVDVGDRRGGGLAGQQPRPERLDVVPRRRLQPETGDDDARPSAMVGAHGGAGRAHAEAPALDSTRPTACPTVATPSRTFSGTVMSKRLTNLIT